MILERLEIAHIFRCGKLPQGLWFESNSGRFRLELSSDEAKGLAIEIMTLARETELRNNEKPSWGVMG